MLSKDMQYNHISAGFALGMINTDLTGENPVLKLSKTNFDSAFWQAWRDWQYSTEFPSISRSAEFRGRCLAPYIFTRKFTCRKFSPSSPLYWEGNTIYTMTDAPSEEDMRDIALDINPSISLDAWVELVENVFTICPNKQ